MLKTLLSLFIKKNGRNPNNLEMILLRQKAAKEAVDERKVVNMFDRKPVDPNKPILGGQNIIETDEQILQRLKKGNEDSINRLKNKKDPPEELAGGGVAGLLGERTGYEGGLRADAPNPRILELMLNEKMSYEDALKEFEMREKQRPYIEERMGTGPGPILEAASGGIARTPFKMGKRAFLKAMGAGAAGIAGLKTGLLGLGKKEVAKEVVKEAATSGSVPPYFFKLVNKIKKLGDDITETGALADRQKVKRYKDYELTEDVTTGRQEITRYKVSDEASYYDQPLTEETYMAYTPGENIIGKGKKPIRTQAEYEEGTAFVRNDRGYTGEVVEESTTISDDIFREVGEELPEAVRKTKAGDIINKAKPGEYADGGRIGYAKGKGVMTLLDLVKNKFGKKSITTADKAPIPPKTLERDMFKKADNRLNDKRQMTADELEDFEMEIGGDNLEAYYFDGTVGDAKRILKEEADYKAEMFAQYKMGKLDPVAGDKSPARKRFLEKKLEDAEMSGDKRLMSVDEIEELATFDLGTDMDKAVNKFKQKDLKQKTELMNFDPPKNRKSNATGGLAAMLGE